MKKRNILIMVLLIFSIVILGVKINVNAQENINISKEAKKEIEKNRAAGIFDLPDDELEQYFIDEVNSRTSASWTLNTMPESELQILTRIDIDGSKYNVKSLDGLDYYIQNGSLSKVVSFSIKSVQKVDINPILNWNGLEELSIFDSEIGDLDFSKANLPNLTYLDSQNTNTSNVTGLDNLPSLDVINLSKNNISNLNFLNGMELFYLDVSENKITDVSSLNNTTYTNLRDLYINDNMIKDLNVISPLIATIASNSGEFNFYDNMIHDYTFLAPYINDLYSLRWNLDDEQHIVIDLGYVEDLSEIPTTFDIILPDGTIETIDLDIDVSSIIDYKDYSFNTPYNIDIPTPGGYSSTFPIVGDITVNFSYVAPIPLTPLDPSIPITVDPTDPDKPEDNINTSDSSNKKTVDNKNNNKEESIVKKLIQTGKENIVIIFSFIILLISFRIIILNKRV